MWPFSNAPLSCLPPFLLLFWFSRDTTRQPARVGPSELPGSRFFFSSFPGSFPWYNTTVQGLRGRSSPAQQVFPYPPAPPSGFFLTAPPETAERGLLPFFSFLAWQTIIRTSRVYQFGMKLPHDVGPDPSFFRTWMPDVRLPDRIEVLTLPPRS